jgi:hypothetical protein
MYHEWWGNNISQMLKVKAEQALTSKERDGNFGRICCSIKSISLLAITKTKMLLLTFLSKVPCQQVACVGTRS